MTPVPNGVYTLQIEIGPEGTATVQFSGPPEATALARRGDNASIDPTPQLYMLIDHMYSIGATKGTFEFAVNRETATNGPESNQENALPLEGKSN